MSNAKHTPGPWTIQDVYCVDRQMHVREVIDAAGNAVAEVRVERTAPVSGPSVDARLIASAPEMYRQLELLVEYINGRDWTDARSDADTVENIKRILVKATGGSHE